LGGYKRRPLFLKPSRCPKAAAERAATIDRSWVSASLLHLS
jgi:hypothetical protein